MHLEHRSAPSRLRLTLDPKARPKSSLFSVIPPTCAHLMAWQKDVVHRRFAEGSVIYISLPCNLQRSSQSASGQPLVLIVRITITTSNR
jgi:hypothetical protein